MSAAFDHDRLAGLLAAMRAFRAGDASARAPKDAEPGEPPIVAELCTLFNEVAEHAQALELELELTRLRLRTERSAERTQAGGRGPAEGGGQRSEPSYPAIIAEPEHAPAILIVESDSAGSRGEAGAGGPAEPMRDAAQTALRGLGGVWDQTAVVRVDSAEAVREAVAAHRVVSALIDARGPLDLLGGVVAALDAAVPGVPLLCFAPDGDPAAADRANALTRGRNSGEVVRSAVQAVERLTLHWLTQAPVAPDPLAESSDSGYGQIRFEGEKVLVVDDDVRNVFAMVSALELYGLTALTADNGPEGLEILLRNPDISVVLMDLMMPGLDGYATTSLIRSRPEFADLPIIAVTARAAPGDRELSLAAGTTEHVTKPVDVDNLLALIKRLIKRP